MGQTRRTRSLAEPPLEEPIANAAERGVRARRMFERLPRATRLSLEGSREVLEEMSNPPADTPERRAMFRVVAEAEELLRRMERSDGMLRVEP